MGGKCYIQQILQYGCALYLQFDKDDMARRMFIKGDKDWYLDYLHDCNCVTVYIGNWDFGKFANVKDLLFLEAIK